MESYVLMNLIGKFVKALLQESYYVSNLLKLSLKYEFYINFVFEFLMMRLLCIGSNLFGELRTYTYSTGNVSKQVKSKSK